LDSAPNGALRVVDGYHPHAVNGCGTAAAPHATPQENAAMPAHVQSSWTIGLIEDEENTAEFPAFDAELDEDAELDDVDGDLDDEDDDFDDDELDDEDDDDLDDDDDDLIDLDDEYDGADEEDRPHPGPGKYEE
jgi:hypothetical protein